MRILLADDSIAFDGFSPTSQPLDGPEKAFAGLAPALARRGHEVTVFNRCAFPVTVDGSRWEGWDGERPSAVEALIASRLPRLLDFVPQADRRLIWLSGPAAALDQPAAEAFIVRHRPRVVFWSQAQRNEWINRLGLDTRVIPPGVAPAYFEETAMNPAGPPRAIATSHPLADVAWLIDLWCKRVRPSVAGAELHVYSALLDRGQLGAELPAGVVPVLAAAHAAQEHGVTIHRPLPDPQMADAYRAARVHLYPGRANEAYASTVADSQATGLPCVARAVSAALVEQVIVGQTGIVAATDDGFANAAIELLSDRARFDRLSAGARSLQRGRTWANMAAEWEACLA